jgi:hypothetical protein
MQAVLKEVEILAATLKIARKKEGQPLKSTKRHAGTSV